MATTTAASGKGLRMGLSLLALVVVAALLVIGYVIGHGQPSKYLVVDHDFTGSLTKVSSDGEGIAVHTPDGNLYSRVVNVGQFPLRPGLTVRGTVVNIQEAGNGQEEAVVIASVG